jgi:hypothetical protein
MAIRLYYGHAFASVLIFAMWFWRGLGIRCYPCAMGEGVLMGQKKANYKFIIGFLNKRRLST